MWKVWKNLRKRRTRTERSNTAFLGGAACHLPSCNIRQCPCCSLLLLPKCAQSVFC